MARRRYGVLLRLLLRMVRMLRQPFLLDLVDVIGLIDQLSLPVSPKLVLPPVRYCHADDPTEVWPAGSAADVAGAVVAIGVADSGTRCRYVHIPLT